MSALAELIEIVRHCDVQYLDQWYGPKADPEDIAAELHGAARAEVLAEAAPKLDEHCERFGVLGVGDVLRRMFEEKATAPAATATPDFFEVGRTYTEPGDTTDWQFRCDAITTHPGTGERTALGWKHSHGQWTECAYPENEWEIHQIADALGQGGGTR